MRRANHVDSGDLLLPGQAICIKQNNTKKINYIFHLYKFNNQKHHYYYSFRILW
uniref:hypothetical protein n=1 Tax=Sphingobacterium micropteri TaxID=2763501 RepID=UPI003742CA0E